MQAQVKVRSILTCFPLLICSCSEQDAIQLLGTGMCLIRSQTDSGPERVPRELLVDEADPAVASQKPNTLVDVPIGTTIDDLSNLDGCWARQQFDGDIGYWEVMKFNVAQRRSIYYRLFPPAPELAPPGFWTDKGGFFTDTYKITILSENQLDLEKIGGEGGTFASGSDTVICGGSGGSFNLVNGDHLSAVATVDGSSLKYAESIDQLDPADPNIQEWAGYWIRFQCP